MAEIGMKRTVRGSFDEVLARIPGALKAEGFGVLTRIDVTQTMKEKLGVDFRRYQILGACNPKFAHQALTAEPGVGVLLPCNVAVWSADDGKTVVSAADPMQTIAAGDPKFAEFLGQVRASLLRVLDALA